MQKSDPTRIVYKKPTLNTKTQVKNEMTENDTYYVTTTQKRLRVAILMTSGL